MPAEVRATQGPGRCPARSLPIALGLIHLSLSSPCPGVQMPPVSPSWPLPASRSSEEATSPSGCSCVGELESPSHILCNLMTCSVRQVGPEVLPLPVGDNRGSGHASHLIASLFPKGPVPEVNPAHYKLSKRAPFPPRPWPPCPSLASPRFPLSSSRRRAPRSRLPRTHPPSPRLNPWPSCLLRDVAERHAKHNMLMVTWANFHYLDFTINWVYHVKKLGITNYLVPFPPLPLLLSVSIPLSRTCTHKPKDGGDEGVRGAPSSTRLPGLTPFPEWICPFHERLGPWTTRSSTSWWRVASTHSQCSLDFQSTTLGGDPQHSTKW